MFGHLEFKMASLEEKLKLLDEKDWFERLGVKKELSMVRRSIDIYWRQRAKQQWIEDGDWNTKFFR